MSEEPETKAKKKNKEAQSQGVNLKGFIEIYPSQELSEFSNSYAKAYRAKNLRDQSDCIAYICDKAYTPRSRAASSYSSILNTSLANLVTSGVVFWAPQNKEQYAFIYLNNLGKPLIPPGKLPHLRWRSEECLKKLVFPVVDALIDLRNADLMHGAIRPDNLYTGGSDEFEQVVLGDCLSAPAFATQPSMYESIERALADPLARGLGTTSDDLYALAATAAMLMCAKDPFDGKTEKEIVKSKMQDGSFVTLIGDQRITGPILEFLRGALNDNPKERWTIDDAQAWRDGRRLSPKQGSKRKKASRPIKFDGENYLVASVLAMDLENNPTEAAQLIESGELEQWLMRSLESRNSYEALEQAVNSARQVGRGVGYNERLISRTIVALDPQSPLKYKGLSLLPDGVGGAMALAYARDENLRAFYDIFNQEMFDFWIARGGEVAFDIATLINRFESCRANIRHETLGYGLERCLYYLNPESACMSLLLKDYFVRTPEELLLAFEDMAGKSKPRYIMDRHIAAFLSIKEPRIVEDQLKFINSDNPVRQTLGVLKILSGIQHISKVEELPNLASWLADSMASAYESYHDRDLRQKLSGEVRKAATKGNLLEMVAILDNEDLAQHDSRKFKASMNEFIHLEKERIALSKGLKNKATFGKTAGQEVAAFTSFVLATLMVVGFVAIVLGINDGSGFLPG